MQNENMTENGKGSSTSPAQSGSLKEEIVVRRYKGSYTYILSELTENSFELEDIYFPFREWSNNITTYYKVRLTQKRAVLSFSEVRDNWNGSGAYGSGKIFIDRQKGVSLLEKAKQAFLENNEDDAEAIVVEIAKELERMEEGEI